MRPRTYGDTRARAPRRCAVCVHFHAEKVRLSSPRGMQIVNWLDATQRNVTANANSRPASVGLYYYAPEAPFVASLYWYRYFHAVDLRTLPGKPYTERRSYTQTAVASCSKCMAVQRGAVQSTTPHAVCSASSRHEGYVTGVKMWRVRSWTGCSGWCSDLYLASWWGHFVWFLNIVSFTPRFRSDEE